MKYKSHINKNKVLTYTIKCIKLKVARVMIAVM